MTRLNIRKRVRRKDGKHKFYTLECVVCNGVYEGRKGSRFCGLKCSGKARRGRQFGKWAKLCIQCGSEFSARAPLKLKCDDCCVCRECGKSLKESSASFCSRRCVGISTIRMMGPQKVAANLIKAQTIALTPAVIQKRAAKQRGLAKVRGPKNGNWRGGKTRRKPRIEDWNWRQSVMRRDRWTCQLCGVKKGLEAHHIKSWAKFPRLRTDVNNGLALCKGCHRHVHSKKEFVA